MTLRLRALIPPKILLDAEALSRAIENTLDNVAKDIKVDFDVTTQTWNERPDFTIEKREGYRFIGTDNEIYGYVNFGTRAHPIRPLGSGVLRFQTGFRPKTVVRQIKSNAGSHFGPFAAAREVMHPGTEARAFDEVIKEKWDGLMQNTFQRAIDAEVSRQSHG